MSYMGDAANIYDSQLRADQATLAAEHAGSAAGYAGEQTTANNAYNDALGTAGKARDANSAKADFTSSTHGLWSSGLAANMQRLVGQDYSDQASKISELRAQKLTDIANRQQADNQAYSSKLGALSSKYGGLKAQYVIEHQDADKKAAQAAAAQQAQWAHEAAMQAANNAAENARAAASRSASAAAKPLSLADAIAQGFNGYKPSSKGGQAKYVENTLLPSLQAAYPTTNFAPKSAAWNAVYSYRKANFGE